MPGASVESSAKIRYDNANGFPGGIIYHDSKRIHHDQRQDYASEHLEFYKKSGLSKTFKEFKLGDLEDVNAAYAYDLGCNMTNFNTDGLEDSSPRVIEKAIMAWKYGVAVAVAKGRNYALKPSEIPSSGTSAFYYFSEALFGRVNPLEILSSLLVNFSIKECDDAEGQWNAYRLGLLIRLTSRDKFTKAQAGVAIGLLEHEAKMRLGRQMVSAA
jgi:hypothetical protein